MIYCSLWNYVLCVELFIASLVILWWCHTLLMSHPYQKFLSGEIRNINSFLTYKCYRTPPAKQIYDFIVLFSKVRGAGRVKICRALAGTIKDAKQQKDGISHQSLELSTSSARYKNNNQQINDINRSSQTKNIHSQVHKMMLPSIQSHFWS